jgi:hypothetical protein
MRRRTAAPPPLLLLPLLLLAACAARCGAANGTQPGARVTPCELGDLTTQEAFTAAALARASRARELVLFNVNEAYAPLAARLVGNLREVGAHHYLSTAYDAHGCAALAARGVCCGHSSLLRGHPGLVPWQLAPGLGFAGRVESTTLFLLKVQTLAWALQAGLRRVLHIDLDVALLANPLAAFHAARFGRVALAAAVDLPSLPPGATAACVAEPGGDLAAAQPRPRLNTGLLLATDADGAALALLNGTFAKIMGRLDDAVAHPPEPCARCFFPTLPDWDLLWEQARAGGAGAGRAMGDVTARALLATCAAGSRALLRPGRARRRC